MAVLSPVAKQQFFTDAGEPAAGYLLYTYAANTTTPQATYSNKGGTVANTNPVVLDSRGEATIYLDPALTYDYVLKTADGVTVWTREDVESDSGLADLAASTGSSLVGFKQSGTGAVARTTQAKLRGIEVSAEDFGAVGDGATDDTAAINLAIDAVSAAGGGEVVLENESYAVSQAGTHETPARGYCIMLKSGVTLVGKPANGAVLQYTRTNDDVDVVVTPETGGIDALVTESVGIRNVRVDGDSGSAATGNGMNFWLQRVRGLLLENIGSVNSTNWGIRVEQCDGVHVDIARADHGPDANADGLHFVDCRNVTGVAEIYTEGDDAFIIETLAHAVYNYDFTVIVRAPNNAAAGRGCLLHHESISSAAAREMKNMNLRVIAQDCTGQAFVTDGALLLSNVNADIVAEGCSHALQFTLGEGVTAGSMRNCHFNLLARNPVETGVSMAFVASSVVEDNTLNAKVYNPGDGTTAVTLRGTRWRGNVDINYNPNADKTTFGFGLDMIADDSVIDLSCRGAGRNCYVRVGADNNIVRLGHLSDAATADIEVVAGHTSPPIFIGGKITGTVLNPTLATFVGVDGAPTYNINAKTDVNVKINGSSKLRVNSTGLGFHGAAPVAKPTVSGSRGSNVALASLLTGLANAGLITDSSTA